MFGVQFHNRIKAILIHFNYSKREHPDLLPAESPALGWTKHTILQELSETKCHTIRQPKRSQQFPLFPNKDDLNVPLYWIICLKNGES